MNEADAAHEKRKADERTARQGTWFLLTEMELWSRVFDVPAQIEETVRVILEFPKECPARRAQFLAAMLPAKAGKFASEPLTTRELMADPVLAALAAPRNAIQVGMLLSRVARDRTVVGGYVIEYVTVENNAALWRVMRSLGQIQFLRT